MGYSQLKEDFFEPLSITSIKKLQSLLLGIQFYWYKVLVFIYIHEKHMNYLAWIEITDFQLSGKMCDTMKYLLHILKIIERHVWFHEFELPQLVFLLKCIIATFDVYKYSFCEINTYCINKQCIIFFYFFFIPSTAKRLINHTR